MLEEQQADPTKHREGQDRKSRSSKVPYIADQAGQDSVLVFQSRSFMLVEMVKRRNSFDLLSDNESEVLSELNG